MNKNQIRTKKKQIALMDADTLEDFAITIHSAVGLRQEAKDELLEAVDDRISKLNNSFALEVEMGEVCDFEMDIYDS